MFRKELQAVSRAFAVAAAGCKNLLCQIDTSVQGSTIHYDAISDKARPIKGQLQSALASAAHSSCSASYRWQQSKPLLSAILHTVIFASS